MMKRKRGRERECWGGLGKQSKHYCLLLIGVWGITKATIIFAKKKK
jgi:hypothetical protein